MTPIPRRVHFVGVGGVGMSALALLLQESGEHVVSGSDRAAGRLTQMLATSGVSVTVGHAADNVGPAELVVRTPAAPMQNVEIAEAVQRGLPVVTRAELLGSMLRGKRAIGIAGTHGKTTTAALIATIAEDAGLDPTVALGGILEPRGRNARSGAGPHFIYEACEGYGALEHVEAEAACVLNIDDNHVDHFGDFAALEGSFASYLERLPAHGVAVVNGDDPALRLHSRAVRARKVLVGLGEGNDLRATNIRAEGLGTCFDVWRRGEGLGPCRVSSLGRHNVVNALAALEMCETLGVPYARAKETLAAMTLPARRFQALGEERGVLVVDDYAHHPTEVEATLEAASSTGRRLVTIFQPHLFSRTLAHHEGLARALCRSDRVVLTDIYAAREEPLPGVSSALIARSLDELGYLSYERASHLDDALETALAAARPGDLLITMGAGDVTLLAPRLLAGLRRSPGAGARTGGSDTAEGVPV